MASTPVVRSCPACGKDITGRQGRARCDECSDRASTRYQANRVSEPEGYLRAACWCGEAVVAVRKEILDAVRTESCGLPRCKPGAVPSWLKPNC